ncbi:beta-1,2-xylosyltransferase RCN11 isoform X1 [Phoenix dactylifera]|uniref:Beta-1,2-xylosyltransferase RCN11 isoform X1 n=1 Tax=Phoenix dactylifera TaxID=42345 RepID=A0A8B7D4Y3_PHODC|nr:beta-1,2-xylosyltransferase RCN11 isoform X1 [Phoenix dactylifera]
MSRRHRRLLLRTLLFLFALNSVSLALYFLFHPRPSSSPETLTLTPPSFPSLKTWPSLPSFLPWSFSPPPPARSCEAYFGHGFSRRIDVLRSSSSSTGGGGWFRCYHSETLASSICEGGRIRMDPGRISMSDGGEALETVMGRGEEQELPRYEPGAFEIEAGEEGIGRADRRVVDEEFLDRYVPQGGIELHTMRALIDSMRLVNPRELECTQWVDEPTVLVTRFEYANLFHTVTDWYSAYVSSRVTNLPNRPNVVFVDGHCKAQLEETWEALFSSIRYAKNFSGPVCFRHAILSPLGYETAMFKGLTESITCQGAPAHILRENPDIRKTARLSEFGEMLRAAFGLLGDGNLPTKPLAGHNILFVRREDYLAHPRHSGKVQSRLTNEQEVFDAIKNWADDHRKCKINVVNGIFAHMCLKEQLRAIQEASVVVGAHGAGLTHLVAATPDTIVLEIISSLYRRPHFALISEWKGLEYHAINLPGSSAEPAAVINKLSRIMGSLGC